jgi:hypothetical protein
VSKTEFDFYKRLKDIGSASKSTVPKTIQASSEFKSLVSSSVLKESFKGRGISYRILKPEQFNNFFHNKFPNGDIEVLTEIDNQKKFRDTKATKLEKKRVVLIRGKQDIIANEIKVNLCKQTKGFDLFTIILNSLYAKKICFVENLEPFLNAEKLLGDGYVYIHFYGRFPKEEVLKKIKCDEYVHFGDYDFVGLNEYIRATKVFKNCTLYIPDNYAELFKSYAVGRKSKDTIYKDVENSQDKQVIKIREQLKTQNKFLEQQVILDGL